MPEQTDRRAHHQAVLNAAAENLRQGDVRAYWKTLEQISPLYARLAGMVAGDEGPLGVGARERLQDAAEDAGGKRLSPAELDGIARSIADRDLAARKAGLKQSGNAGVSLQQTDTYHQQAFKDLGLTADTYTLHPLVRLLGPMAEAWRDADAPDDPDAKARFADAAARNRMTVGEGLRLYNDFSTSNMSFVSDVIEGYLDNFTGWSEERLRHLRTLLDDGKSLELPGGGGAGLVPRDGFDRDAFRQVMERRLASRDDAERGALFAIEQAHVDHLYGTAPAKRDATGRVIDPQPVNVANRESAPALSADGKPLEVSLGAIAGRVADLASSGGGTDAVKALQRGLNILKETTPASPLMFAALKDDGIPGPKTRAALRQAAAALGAGKLEEGFALGRFHRYAKEAVDRQGGDLKRETERAFGSLFHRPGETGPAVPEGYGLQMAVNDLGRDLMGTGFQPIREDGDIGPKTTEAFHSVLRAAGPERFTAQLGRSMGFAGFRDDTLSAAG